MCAITLLCDATFGDCASKPLRRIILSLKFNPRRAVDDTLRETLRSRRVCYLATHPSRCHRFSSFIISTRSRALVTQRLSTSHILRRGLATRYIIPDLKNSIMERGKY